MDDQGRELIAGRYGLSRDNFILDPIEDFDCFARDDIAVQDIAEGLDIDLVTGLGAEALGMGAVRWREDTHVDENYERVVEADRYQADSYRVPRLVQKVTLPRPLP